MSSDAIFLKQGDHLVELRSEDYESEELLQQLLANYPDLLAGGQMDEQSPRRWLLINRELGLPAEEQGVARFAVDHLFVDQDGVPTIVEVKRSSDTRLRREVVGQMLDYAANSVRYWPIGELREALARRCEAEGRATESVIAELTLDDTEPDAFWGRVEQNLATGQIRMVFVADRIPTELQAIVEFLNEQMQRAQVLAVEVKQYVGSGVQALVPRVIGMTAVAQHVKKQGPRGTFAEYLAKASDASREFEQRILDLVENSDLSTGLTPTARRVRTAAGVHLFYFYPQWESVEFMLSSVWDAGLDEEARQIHDLLSRIAGKTLTRRHPYVATDSLIHNWQTFRADVWGRYADARTRAAELSQEQRHASDAIG